MNILAWESEGGSLGTALNRRLTGTADQIEWAERIRTSVNGEFDRVAKALDIAARKHPRRPPSDSEELQGILEDKRSAVMANERAGYFITDWQELRDQVRRMIMSDARYQAMKARR